MDSLGRCYSKREGLNLTILLWNNNILDNTRLSSYPWYGLLQKRMVKVNYSPQEKRYSRFSLSFEDTKVGILGMTDTLKKIVRDILLEASN